MLWFLYQFLFTIGFLLMLPKFLLRMRRRGGYGAHFAERLGSYAPDVAARLAETPRIWVHAVSVGEIYVALGLIAEWRRRRPADRFVLSVTTSTGRALAEKNLPKEDVLVYFPVDFPPVVRRAMRAIRPRALILIECELWPNLLRRAARAGVPIALINGRISERSFRGYRKLRVFTRRLLPLAGRLCVQTAADRDRLLELGAPADRLVVTGSAKYEVAQRDADAEAKARAALRALGWPEDAPVLLGGSTWPGEEEALLDLLRELRGAFPALRLVIAPRHAERTESILPLLCARGLSVARRSRPEPGAATPDVFLLDTTGELKNFYAAADVIFVGKSLAEHGGQNPIEPALCGRAIVVGPNMENFPAVMADFLQAEALVQVRDADGLERAARALLADPARRVNLGNRAVDLVREKSGALGRTADLLEELIPRT